ncbi:MAG: glutamate-5-semialdehyde dehydrogenase [Acidobacteriota bacterium]
MNAEQRNGVLNSLARLLGENKSDIIAANRVDVAACPADDPVILDRLRIDEAKIKKMAVSMRSVIERPDPVGSLISSHTRSDGLLIENRKVPFGTVLIIYEARPDVTVEAGAIALKAGNRILLKGGTEARNTNLCLADLWGQALEESAADTSFVRFLDLSREETRELICGKTEHFDVVIPRGGDTLIDFVVENSKAPVIVSGRGNNFLFVDREADLEMALKIAMDGKSRLSVCNALDKVLVDRSLPDLDSFLQVLASEFVSAEIEVFGDGDVCSAAGSVASIKNEDVWYEEFLSAKVVIGIARGLNDAIARINKYAGGHSAAIVTNNKENADRFLNEVDCAAVYHNASVRFTDGGEFGLGAEIAISTQKLHLRGPLGAEHLMTNKWFVKGSGQIRG